MDIYIMVDESPYSKRELDEKFTDIIDTLGRIETQTTTTNGKVAAISGWRERTTGAMWAFGCCLVLIIIPIAGWALYNQVTEPERIQSAVSTYFNENYSKVEQVNQ